MPTVMPRDYATVQYVHSKVIQYYPSIVDLRWCQSIHSCDVCPFQSRDALTPSICQAVHYGMCLPVRAPLPREQQKPQLPPKRRLTIPIRLIQDASRKDAFEAVIVKRVPQDEDAAAFLRQKQDELLQKREQEQKRLQDERESQRITAAAETPSSIPTKVSVVVPSYPSSPITVFPAADTDALSSSKPASAPVETVKQSESVAADAGVVSSPQQAEVREVSEDVDVTPKFASQPPITSLLVPPTVSDQTSNTASRKQFTDIPRFYFPGGRPAEDAAAELTQTRVTEVFDKIDGGKAAAQHMGPLLKACGLPFYWKCPFFHFLEEECSGSITLPNFLSSLKRLFDSCPDDATRFVRILAKQGKNSLEFDDFVPFMQDVVNTHPGLAFLQDAPEFHSRYIQTVIARIFYCVNRTWSGRISAPEIRKSNLLQTISVLEEEDDINQILDYFSYEHFYVIYCKFWELDKDHDLLLSRADLLRHCDHAINSKIIDRIFSGAVTRNLVDGKLSYRDFVWFLISEEDKRHPRSIEYWFRCMDMDGDGILSMYELEFFYREQLEKMEVLGVETLPFEDCLCQMLDMIQPREEGKIRLCDLKSCSLTSIFFDTFINLDKYLEHEQKDPFASLRDQFGNDPGLSDWERYAAEEYEVLVAEESGHDFVPEEALYDDPSQAEASGAAEQLRNLPEMLRSQLDAENSSVQGFPAEAEISC